MRASCHLRVIRMGDESEREIQQKQAITFIRMIGDSMGMSPFAVEDAIQMVHGANAEGIEALGESELDSEEMELFMNMMEEDRDEDQGDE